MEVVIHDKGDVIAVPVNSVADEYQREYQVPTSLFGSSCYLPTLRYRSPASSLRGARHERQSNLTAWMYLNQLQRTSYWRKHAVKQCAVACLCLARLFVSVFYRYTIKHSDMKGTSTPRCKATLHACASWGSLGKILIW
jgi:hypothetical protein